MSGSYCLYSYFTAKEAEIQEMRQLVNGHMAGKWSGIMFTDNPVSPLL
jgi:hypothetical protein